MLACVSFLDNLFSKTFNLTRQGGKAKKDSMFGWMTNERCWQLVLQFWRSFLLFQSAKSNRNLSNCFFGLFLTQNMQKVLFQIEWMSGMHGSHPIGDHHGLLRTWLVIIIVRFKLLFHHVEIIWFGFLFVPINFSIYLSTFFFSVNRFGMLWHWRENFTNCLLA